MLYVSVPCEDDCSTERTRDVMSLRSGRVGRCSPRMVRTTGCSSEGGDGEGGGEDGKRTGGGEEHAADRDVVEAISTVDAEVGVPEPLLCFFIVTALILEPVDTT
jgi:hypothetical protein